MQGMLLGETTRALRLSSERRVDRDHQPREVVDGHGAHRDELDGVDLQEARGGDDVARDLREWVVLLR